MKVIILIVCTGFAQLCSAVTIKQVENATSVCNGLLNGQNQRIAGFVRLAFHDCVGGCDGCVDMSNTENAGLNAYIDPLNQAYNNNKVVSDAMSRADFWMTCAAAAVTRGHQVSNRNRAPVITVKYGRKTCTNTPTDRKFPDAKHGLSSTLAYFKDADGFALNDVEIVALLGAHTLGEARRANSGFQGPWVNNKNSLDNDYYVQVLRPWDQVPVVQNQPNGLYQWIRAGGVRPPNLMLNADMCLVKDIKPNNDTGRNDPRNSNQIANSSTIDIVQRFSRNNTDWLEQFGKVFTKMISKTANGETLLVATNEVASVTTAGPAAATRPAATTRPAAATRPAATTGAGAGVRQGCKGVHRNISGPKEPWKKPAFGWRPKGVGPYQRT